MPRKAAPRQAKPGKESSPKKRPKRPVASVTKRLRMTPQEARELARLAKASGKTESDLLREGLEAIKLRERRRALLDELLAGASPEDYEKLRFELR